MTDDARWGAAVDAVDALLIANVRADRGGPDGGELVAHLLSAVAARHGSSDWLIAGRPGSWEADFVNRLVKGTVGWSDEYLSDYASEPSGP